MRGDQSAPRAHRTGLIIFMTLPRTRGCSADEMPHPRRRRRRRITNLRQEREGNDIPPTVLVTTTCRLVTGISPSAAFYFASCSPFITCYSDRDGLWN